MEKSELIDLINDYGLEEIKIRWPTDEDEGVAISFLLDDGRTFVFDTALVETDEMPLFEQHGDRLVEVNRYPVEQHEDET